MNNEENKWVKVFCDNIFDDFSGWSVAGYVLKIGSKLNMEKLYSDWETLYAEVAKTLYKHFPKEIQALDFVSKSAEKMLRAYYIDEDVYIDLAFPKKYIAEKIVEMQKCCESKIKLKIVLYKANAAKQSIENVFTDIVIEFTENKKVLTMGKPLTIQSCKNNEEKLKKGKVNKSKKRVPCLAEIYKLSIEKYKNLLLVDCRLTVRTLTFLNNAGFKNFGEVLELSKEHFCAMPGYKSEYYYEIIKFAKGVRDKENKTLYESYNLSFAARFNIEEKRYTHAMIIKQPLSSRVINCLFQKKLFTVADLLQTTPEELMKIKGFGITSLEEVLQFCSNLQTKDVKIFTPNLVVDDYAIKDNFDSDECKTSLPIKDNLTFDEDEIIRTMIEVLSMLLGIPIVRRKQNALGYILAFTTNQIKRGELLNFYKNGAFLLGDIEIVSLKDNMKDVELLLSFLKWCQYDLEDEIRQLFKSLFEDKFYEQILHLRAEGMSLEMVSKELNFSRERIRQIENKCRIIFQRWLACTRFLNKVCAEKNGETCIKSDYLKAYFRDKSNIIEYLLKTIETSNYYYDSENESIVIL